MVAAVSGSTQLARIFDQTRQIRQLNLQLTLQQGQLSSGRYANGLVGVASRAQEVGDLKAELKTVENYKSGTLTAQNRVRLYGLTLEQIIDTATDAKDLMIKNRDSFFASTSAPTTQANVLLDRVGTLLQTKDGDRFIYGGRNFQVNPINGQLSSNALLGQNYGAGAVPGAYTNITEADPVASQVEYLNFPSTDDGENFQIKDNYYFDRTGYAPVDDPATPGVDESTTGAVETEFVGLYVDDNERVEYGQTAADPAFQRVVDAIVRFRSAIQDIGDSQLYTQRVDDAIAHLETAISQLQNLASANGHVEQRLKEVQTRHDRSTDVLKTRIGNIENVDVAETATLIKSLQTSLEASYTITRDSLQLSLVNYLK